MENKFLKGELAKFIGAENIDIPSVSELEKILGIPAMGGVPGTLTGGDRNPADSNFPAIGNPNAGKASKEFEGSRVGAKMKNLSNADHLKGNTALKMM